MTGPTGLVAVVDDDDAVRDSLRFLLEIAGYSVASYGSAAQFLHEAPIGDLSASWWTSTCPSRRGCSWLPACAARV